MNQHGLARPVGTISANALKAVHGCQLIPSLRSISRMGTYCWRINLTERVGCRVCNVCPNLGESVLPILRTFSYSDQK